MKEEMPAVYLGLGANVGECKKTMLRAVLALVRYNFVLKGYSSLYRTAPWGREDQADFLNAVVTGTWQNSPENILEAILEVEASLGRTRHEGERWGPRVIDIDLLAIGQTVLNTAHLTLPHPSMADRLFVLMPFKELSPHWIHPISGLSAQEMLLNCPDKGFLDVVEERWLVN